MCSVFFIALAKVSDRDLLVDTQSQMTCTWGEKKCDLGILSRNTLIVNTVIYSIMSPSFFFFLLVNVMRCAICHQDYKQSDIIDNYFVKDTTEATSTADEKAAQVPQIICQSSFLLNIGLYSLSYYRLHKFRNVTRDIRHHC